MERMVNIAGTGLLVLVAAAIVFNGLDNPMDGRRESLKVALADVRAADGAEEAIAWDFESWNRTITGKGSVWSELVPPP
ncbi:MAG: hypothetical protein GX580_01195, partial [Candidatus Hydrogenedens sp.]|nr:hypothetical protein [Candidatus Hydrogenedens sp.]